MQNCPKVFEGVRWYSRGAAEVESDCESEGEGGFGTDSERLLEFKRLGVPAPRRRGVLASRRGPYKI